MTMRCFALATRSAAAALALTCGVASAVSCDRVIPKALREVSSSSSSSSSSSLVSSGDTGTGSSAAEQSNDSFDLDRATEIRRNIVRDDTLSVAAHNVAVIVHDDVVTLQGTVESGVERAMVVQAAKQAAPGYRIEDRLVPRR